MGPLATIQSRPLIVGVTGGVGAGKSACLSFLGEICSCQVIYADWEAGQLRRRGEACFGPLVELFGGEILGEDGEIDAGRMAERMFGKAELLARVNAIIHPAVNARILGLLEAARRERAYDFVFLEAALLIENGYERIVDEMWYIYADAAVRRERLRRDRGYSDRRIDEILAGQLAEEVYRAHCGVVIDNSGDWTATKEQIEGLVRERIGGTKRTAG